MDTNTSLFTRFVIGKIQDGQDNKSIFSAYLNSEYKLDNQIDESVKRNIRQIRKVVDELDYYNKENNNELTETTLINRVEKDTDLEVALKSYDIKDINGLVKWSNIDESVWECYYKQVRASNNGTNPWYITEGRFRKRTNIDPEQVIKRCEDLVSKYKPKLINQQAIKKGKYCLEIDFPDVHMGNRNFDNTESLEKSGEQFRDGISYMLKKAENKPLDEIIFMVGSDYFHINADKQETKKGTFQETTDFPHDIIDFSSELIVDTLFTLSKHARKVIVKVVPGNHDWHNVSWLGILLKQVFKNCKNIEVDYKLEERKYHTFGCTAFVFTHELMNKQDTLSIIMFHELKDKGLLTDQIQYYEVHGGHKHASSKTNHPSETTNQMITQRVLSALTDNGMWSHGKYGVKVKEAQAFLYSKDHGIEEQYIFRP